MPTLETWPRPGYIMSRHLHTAQAARAGILSIYKLTSAIMGWATPNLENTTCTLSRGGQKGQHKVPRASCLFNMDMKTRSRHSRESMSHRVEGPKNKNKKLSTDLLETHAREQNSKCAP